MMKKTFIQAVILLCLMMCFQAKENEDKYETNDWKFFVKIIAKMWCNS